MQVLDEQSEGARHKEQVADPKGRQVAVGRGPHRPAREYYEGKEVTHQAEAADSHPGDTHEVVGDRLPDISLVVVLGLRGEGEFEELLTVHQ